MPAFIGTDVSVDPDDAVERIGINFRAMPANELAGYVMSAAAVIDACGFHIGATAAREAASRIGEPAIGRLSCLLGGIVIGGCIVAATLTGFERSPTNAAKKTDRIPITMEVAR